MYICKKNSKKYIHSAFIQKLEELKKEEEKLKLTKIETYLNFEKIINQLKDKTLNLLMIFLKEKDSTCVRCEHKRKRSFTTLWIK